MRKFVIALVAATAAAFFGAAAQAEGIPGVVTVHRGNTFDVPTGYVVVDTFDTSVPGAADTSVAPGFTWVGDEWAPGLSGPLIASGAIPGLAAQPVIDPSTLDTTNYGYVEGLTSEALVAAKPYTSYTIYVGSFTHDNEISFYSGNTLIYTYTGVDLPNTEPLWSSGRLTFDFATGVDKVVFSTLGNSLEIENIGVAVPEASIWAMLVLGFGMMGLALRANRRSSVSTMAAVA